ncbi:hypothetical protein AMECASPLE_024249 [Ameca splendens]|uniref:Ricin B lectin domain-containing protein n=1 Tax=Ameca splendens TaxID=208324 RepID=A0ABV0XHG7_9TELE
MEGLGMETVTHPHSPLMSIHPSPPVLPSQKSGIVLGVKALDDSCSKGMRFGTVLVCVPVSMQSNEQHRNKIAAPTWTNGLLLFFYKCTLYLLIFSLGLKRSDTAPVEPDDFAFFLEGTNMCLGVLANTLSLTPSCEEPYQRWKWVSRGRLFNLGASLCLGLNTGNVTYSFHDPPMAVYTCDREPPRVEWTWNCGEVLDKLNSLTQASWNGSAISTSDKWRLYGDEPDLCSKTYQGLNGIKSSLISLATFTVQTLPHKKNLS